MGSRDKNEGSALGRQIEYERQCLKIAYAIIDYEKLVDRMYDDDQEVRSMSIRLPEDGRADYLVVVRLYDEGKPVVGFHGAPTLNEALVGIINRMKNRSIKYREDSYGSQSSSE